MKLKVNGLEINLLVGADPELFVTNSSRLVSAYDMIPGTKETPHPVISGAIQVDGMAVEFNINPANTRSDFVSNIRTVLSELQTALPRGHKLDPRATADFGKDYIEAQPFQAKDLGCEPDYNAYTRSVNIKPDVDTPFRTASGHVHIGWGQGAGGESHDALCCTVVKWMDVFLGLPSVVMDSDVKRRELYGKAGAYRPKSYGVEYRVVSNFWLKEDKYIKFVYDAVVKSVSAAMRQDELPKYLEDSIQDVINKSKHQEVFGLYREITGGGLRCP